MSWDTHEIKNAVGCFGQSFKLKRKETTSVSAVKEVTILQSVVVL